MLFRSGESGAGHIRPQSGVAGLCELLSDGQLQGAVCENDGLDSTTAACQAACALEASVTPASPLAAIGLFGRLRQNAYAKLAEFEESLSQLVHAQCMAPRTGWGFSTSPQSKPAFCLQDDLKQEPSTDPSTDPYVRLYGREGWILANHRCPPYSMALR